MFSLFSDEKTSESDQVNPSPDTNGGIIRNPIRINSQRRNLLIIKQDFKKNNHALKKTINKRFTPKEKAIRPANASTAARILSIFLKKLIFTRRITTTRGI